MSSGRAAAVSEQHTHAHGDEDANAIRFFGESVSARFESDDESGKQNKNDGKALSIEIGKDRRLAFGD